MEPEEATKLCRGLDEKLDEGIEISMVYSDGRFLFTYAYRAKFRSSNNP